MEDDKSLPLVALIGRPNVGKSSLFNALTRTRRAIVADQPGVTRDRRFGEAVHDVLAGRRVRIVDTGGWMPEQWRRTREDAGLLENIERQVLQALEEACAVVQVVDAREGPTGLDEEIGRFARKLGKPYFIAANKVDMPDLTFQEAEFYRLGAEEVVRMSAEHRLGLEELWEALRPTLDAAEASALGAEEAVKEAAGVPQFTVCIVGRPNVGKSSLLNRIVGEERSVASPMPGTTTDPVDITLDAAGVRFTVVDTAGIRRHAKRKDDVEDLAVMYAKRNLETADLAFLLVDAVDGITSQDATIAALVEDAGCAAIVLANKWDLAPDQVRSTPDSIEKFAELVWKDMPFLEYAPVLCVSADKGRLYGAKQGVDQLDAEPWPLPKEFSGIWDLARHLIEAREVQIPSAEMSDLIRQAIAVGPKMVNNVGSLRRPHQVGTRPPQFMVYVAQPQKVPDAFRRYLSRLVRERYGYRGNPIRWVFKKKS